MINNIEYTVYVLSEGDILKAAKIWQIDIKEAYSWIGLMRYKSIVENVQMNRK